MTKLLRRFMLCRQGVTAIEYALIASLIAIVIVTGVGTAGTQLITNGPQTNPGDVSPSWSAQRNVAESENYDRLLKGNPAFRQARMRKECGPITDPQLHQQCLDSFARY